MKLEHCPKCHRPLCPSCGAKEWHGVVSHRRGCKLQAALAESEQRDLDRISWRRPSFTRQLRESERYALALIGRKVAPGATAHVKFFPDRFERRIVVAGKSWWPDRHQTAPHVNHPCSGGGK